MKARITFITSVLGWLIVAQVEAAPPTLSDPVRSGNQFQFTLGGETNGIYIIQTSTNLQNWKSVLTNYGFAGSRVLSLNAPEVQSYYRAVTARPLFGYALAARGQIELTGNTLRVDSFDSADPNWSTNGQYDPSKAGDRAEVATASQLPNAISIGDAEIAGMVRTGPGAAVTLGANGAVGSSAWLADPSHSGTIEPGHYADDMTTIFPDATLPIPFGPAFVPAPGTVAGTNYNYVLGDGDYRVAAFSLTGSGKMIVTGNARLLVVGNVTVSGDAYVLMGQSASLKLYVGGATASFGGRGVITSGDATKFSYYGLPSNTSVSIADNSLTGTIYAPRAHCSITAGGSEIRHIAGGCVAHSISLYGSLQFHYDENLKRVGPAFPASP